MSDTPVNVEQLDTVNVGESHPPANDTLTVRIVVILLGAIVLAIITATALLTLDGKALPDAILALGGVGVGALASLLASTASRSH